LLADAAQFKVYAVLEGTPVGVVVAGEFVAGDPDGALVAGELVTGEPDVAGRKEDVWPKM